MAHEIRSGAWRPISALDAARRELRGEPVDWIEGAGFVVYDEQALAETQAAAASIAKGAPHVPAAFINAIAEEGTKAEAVSYLQKYWNETCALREEIRALRTNDPAAKWIAYADKLEKVIELVAGSSVDQLTKLHAENGLRVVSVARPEGTT